MHGVCRPLRADECLPVLTHRLVTESVDKTGGDSDIKDTSSRRRRKDSGKRGDHKKKDRKVCITHCRRESWVS